MPSALAWWMNWADWKRRCADASKLPDTEGDFRIVKHPEQEDVKELLKELNGEAKAGDRRSSARMRNCLSIRKNAPGEADERHQARMPFDLEVH